MIACKADKLFSHLPTLLLFYKAGASNCWEYRILNINQCPQIYSHIKPFITLAGLTLPIGSMYGRLMLTFVVY